MVIRAIDDQISSDIPTPKQVVARKRSRINLANPRYTAKILPTDNGNKTIELPSREQM
jgi:hypothetical protein